ncbi:MAG: bifunctional (p)ppGpp synthetase/guanosine-3',5'-bis(diphosphate) 3'-pyrophosphohydrolase [Gallionella sp.]|jgi:GTP pyrophosphokinase|nr:bifunctional (p)ppGpp synthetase/guanosine-3',5'-bis(diphosphate) 3'-pyrophosphohydrolase [Gallionella sp.]
MVSVHHAVAHDPNNTAAWLDSGAFTPAEAGAIVRAIAYVEPLYEGRVELTGAPLLQHALGAAGILLGMNMDAATLTAAILHAVPACTEDWAEKLEAEFGSGVRVLVLGISRMEQIRQFSDMPTQQQGPSGSAQLENLRKMLLAMVEDIRVVLIKLALRTQTLRNLSGASAEQQTRIAQETQSIFAPLANRLGVWQLKWELEDLAVRYLEPERYKKVARLLDERRVDREQYIAAFLAVLQAELDKAGIAAQVTGRPKHIYSIINKMKRKQLDFDQLYDVRAVRILVDSVPDCYAALGVVQSLWPPIPGEFDDYIARPKSNNYRSLHTAVIGPRGLAVEVQIRTHEMHQSSELGVAAHWRYKEGAKSDAKFDEQIVWLRQILEWKSEVATQDDTQFKNELFGEQVYVFTPQGKVIDLPRGATPVDFAYTLHTDLGHRTRGAKVNGSIVPLNTKLQNGQRVEILTIKLGAPSRDWLNPSLGYLQSSRARARVRSWFNNQNIADSIAQGRALLDKELHRLGVGDINQERLAQRLDYHKLDDFFAALGRNLVTQRRIAQAIQSELPGKTISVPVQARTGSTRVSKAQITVGGVNNLMTKNAQCCKPEQTDVIVGYITRDRGITIHKQGCTFLSRLAETRPERVLTAQWASPKESAPR